jgi:hypothetical protein
VIWLLLMLAAQSFWQTREPGDWTRMEAQTLLRASPWTGLADVESKMAGAPLPVVLLSAAPVQHALDRLDQTEPEPTSLGDAAAELPEWRLLLREKPGAYVMLGVVLPDPDRAEEGRESKEFERQTAMRAGKRRVKPEMVFPPSRRMPWTILVFPRPAGVESAKSLRFELYVPGAGNPFRAVEFKVADLMYQGRAEF